MHESWQVVNVTETNVGAVHRLRSINAENCFFSE